MEFIAGYCTEAGTTKKVNQDSMCIKQAQTSAGMVTMAAICDGMGGLSKGELASATVIRSFSGWFEKELPEIIRSQNLKEVRRQWTGLIQEQNQRLWNYGNANGVQLGTTLTALLLFGQGKYFIAQVGDSRAYEIRDRIVQLTEDQSFVAREVKRGNMTEEQAKRNTKRNVLLQCIGASPNVEPDILEGEPKPGSTYLLCSDGFRHELTEEEMRERVSGISLFDSAEMTHLLAELVHLNEARGEKDNITAILIHIL